MSNKNKNTVQTNTPANTGAIQLPADFATMTPLQQAIIINKLQAQLAPVLAENKEKEVARIQGLIDAKQKEIDVLKAELKGFGVGTRGRPAGVPNKAKQAEKAAVLEVLKGGAENIAPAPVETATTAPAAVAA